MGIRISMRLIVGVNDFRGEDDVRFKERVDWEDFQTRRVVTKPENTYPWIIAHKLPEFDETDHTIPLADVVYWTDGSEFGSKGLFGAIVAELPYAHDCLYALATLDSRFQTDGYTEVGKYSETCMYAKSRKRSDVNLDQLYKLGLDGYFSWWSTAALFFMKELGFQIDHNDLRMYLEWHWS